MVRLVRTDFTSKNDSDLFYLSDEFEVSQNMFTYDSFKKHEVFLPKYMADNVYSLNLLSKKYLEDNQFLIHIADNEYIILFNHKTVYTGKINQNFITDDMIKSILINKHIVMLSSGGTIENIYYVINSKYKHAIENILKQNTKNEKGNVIAKSLGDIRELVKDLNELDTYKSHISKLIYSTLLVGGSIWSIFFGLNMLADRLIEKESLDNLTQELKIEGQLMQRQEISLRKNETMYYDVAKCITKPEVIQ